MNLNTHHCPNSAFLDSAGLNCRRVAPAAAWLLMVLSVGLKSGIAAPQSDSTEGKEVVAVSARASSDYIRAIGTDGKPVPETFAFAKGGVWRTSEAGTTNDLDFMQVAKTVAEPLASQKYLSSRDPQTTKLLIMVYWGTTHVPDHATNSIAYQNLAAANQAALTANLGAHMVHFNPADSCAPSEMEQGSQINHAVRTAEQDTMENAVTGAMAMASAEDDQRNRLNKQNAMMLGYDSSWADTAQYKDTPLEYLRSDLVSELEDRRYFVVLMAYDFQKIWKEKKAKLLWETRFSVREHGDDFAKRLAAMASGAAPYFGKDVEKLFHTPLPEGHVDVGPLKNLAFVDSK